VRPGRLAAANGDRVIFAALAVFALTQLIAISWDLPSSFSWENDGIAPRDLFGGIAFNLTPGKGHRYPLLHYLVVGLPSLCVLVPAALSAEDFSLAAVQARVLTVPVMTAVSLIAKLITIAMGAVSVLTLARIAERTVSRRAARFAAGFAVTSLSFAYYARVSNLDVPALMWTLLALSALLDVAERQRTRDHVAFAVFAAAAVATKDQAYASFVLLLPFYLLLPGFRPWRALAALATAALAYAVTSGALFNPRGLAARVALLTGPNSQDWRQYPFDPGGVLENVGGVLASVANYFWPLPLLIVAALGIGIAFVLPGPDGLKTRRFRAMPLVAALSHLGFFVLVAGRSEDRFLLPLGLALSYYGGLACDAALTRRSSVASRLRPLATAVVGVLLVVSAARSFQVQLTQLGDARYEVERYVAQLPAGVTVETYGLLVYLPRFDALEGPAHRIQRVDPSSTSGRNPLPGALELQAPYQAIAKRAPDVLVIPESYAERFLAGGAGFSAAVRRNPPADAVEFFRAAVAGRLPGYRIAFVAEPRLPRWAELLGAEPVRLHGSTGARVWVLERAPAQASSQRAQRGQRELGAPVPVEAARAYRPQTAQLALQGVVPEQALELTRDVGDVEGIAVHGGLAAHLRQRAGTSHECGDAGRHGLERRQPETLVERRQDQRPRVRDQAPELELTDRAAENDAALPFQARDRDVVEQLAVDEAFALPGDHQVVRNARGDARKRFEQAPHVLVRLDVADVEHVRALARRITGPRLEPAPIHAVVHDADRLLQRPQIARKLGGRELGHAEYAIGAKLHALEHGARVEELVPARVQCARERIREQVVHRDQHAAAKQERQVDVRRPEHARFARHGERERELFTRRIDAGVADPELDARREDTQLRKLGAPGQPDEVEVVRQRRDARHEVPQISPDPGSERHPAIHGDDRRVLHGQNPRSMR
jgi:hypothetical protein